MTARGAPNVRSGCGDVESAIARCGWLSGLLGADGECGSIEAAEGLRSVALPADDHISYAKGIRACVQHTHIHTCILALHTYTHTHTSTHTHPDINTYALLHKNTHPRHTHTQWRTSVLLANGLRGALAASVSDASLCTSLK